MCPASIGREKNFWSLFLSPKKSKRLHNKATNTQFKTITTTKTKLANTLSLSLSKIPRLWFWIKFTLRVGGFVCLFVWFVLFCFVFVFVLFIYLFIFIFIWEKQSRGKKKQFFSRRNSKKPKCNFFSKDLIFMDYLFIYYLLLLLLLLLFLVEFWFPSMSTHLLICWVFTWVLLERWECESQAWAWEVRLVRGVSLRGKTVRGVREKEKRNKTTQHFRVQIRPVRMWRKKMLERCGRGVRDIQRGRESELDCLGWVRVRRKGRGKEARA